jgi:hypothetical protein
MVTRLLLLMALALPVSAAEVAGVKIEDTARVADAQLALKGAGLRKRLFVQVYAMGLYVADRRADPIARKAAPSASRSTCCATWTRRPSPRRWWMACGRTTTQ